MVALSVKRGLSSPAVTSIPEKWDRQWFRYFIDNFLTNADIRNVQGTGITVSGNVSGNSTTGTANTSVTLTLASIANNSVLGNISGATAAPVAINQAQLTALINLFSSTLSGAVPASGGGIINYLRADGTWANPSTAAANPTAKVGPTVVNGSALTFMRSDAAPPIDLTANYSWTGTNTFNVPIPVASGGTGTSTPNLIQGTGIIITGTWPNQTINTTVVAPVGANPSSSVQLATVNGSASTFMRSDAAPPINQSIAPTWGSNHTFTPASGVGVTINAQVGSSGLVVNGNTSGIASLIVSGLAAGTSGTEFNIRRAGSNANQVLQGPSVDLSDSTATTASAIQHSGGQFELWMTQNNGVNWSQVFKVLTTNAIVINNPTGGHTVTINGTTGNSPVSLVTPAAGNYPLQFTDGTHIGGFFTSGTAGVEVQFGSISNHGLAFFTNNGNPALQIGTGKNVQINAPTSGQPLTIAGTGALSAAINFGTQYWATGAATPTLSANKPGSNAGVIDWVQVSLNGTTGYIPVFG